MATALTLTIGEQSFLFDDDELSALSELNFLYGASGAEIGRMLIAREILSESEVLHASMFVRNVRAKLGDPLSVFDHGRGLGTVCFQHKGWYELVKNSGVRYRKKTRRYVPGQKGVIASIDEVVYARGRSVPDALLGAQTLGDLASVVSALNNLERAVALALAGASLASHPVKTYEVF